MNPSEYEVLANIFTVEVTTGEHGPRLAPLFSNSMWEARRTATPEIYHVIEVSELWLETHHFDVNGVSTHRSG